MEAQLLKILRQGTRQELENPRFYELLAEIKDAFYNREYLKIFTNPSLIPIYAAAYAPSRALCFQSIFNNNPILRRALHKDDAYIYALGAGSGSELIGIGTCVLANPSISTTTLHIQDLSDNIPMLERMHAALESLHVQPNDQCLNNQSTHTHQTIPKTRVEYSVQDLFAKNTNVDNLFSKASLITACFLMNELLASSKKDFALFIMRMVAKMKPGCLLLVIDSAGSFSDLEVGGSQYTCYKLLDGVCAFQTVYSSDSEWYRFPKGLKYHASLKLNNMRYYIRVYEKI